MASVTCLAASVMGFAGHSMSHGGYRPAAGRPKGSKTMRRETPAPRPKHAGPVGEQFPLDYMLDVMNDPGADDGRRDRMAIAAAPYVHARADAAKLGKKEEAEQEALTAKRGTRWEQLLN